MPSRVLTLLVCFAVLAGSSMSFAQNPLQGLSSQQIQKFRSLSPAEQRRLAKQFGIALPQITSSVQGEKLANTIERENSLAIPTASVDEDQSQEKYQSDDGLPYFGYEVFAGKATSFTPIADLPIPADYIVAPGDELSIQLYGKENEQYLLRVGRSGAIELPKLGPISVAGKRFSQVKEDLTQRIQSQIIGANVSVALGELRLIQVYVLGDAAQPGAYSLSSLATVSQALIAAGGIAKTGSLRKIDIRRGSRRITSLDLYDLLVHGQRGNDVRLQSGDAIFIHPVSERVAVSGEVLREGIYELRGNTSLADALKVAGGILPEGYAGRIQIARQSELGRSVRTSDLGRPEGRSFLLKAGDKIRVLRKNAGYRDDVQLSGAFVEPGRVGLTPGMRVTDVIGSAGVNLRDDADKSMALIVRRDTQRNISVVYVSLANILADFHSTDNYTLQAGDELMVLPSFDRLLEAQLAPEEEAESNIYLPSPKGDAEEYNEREMLSDSALLKDAELLKEKKLPFAKVKEKALREILAEVSAARETLLRPVLEALKAQSVAEQYQSIVEVAGRVKFPGKYPYMQNMTADGLLVLAGGMLEGAHEESAELTRLVPRGGDFRLEFQALPLAPASLRKFRLQPRDRINIFQSPDWDSSVAVTITGEVLFPGRYVVARGQALNDVIRRAGGLNEYAFAEGAVLSRESLKKREARELARLRNRLKEEVATLSLRKGTAISGLSVSPGEAIDAVDKLSDIDALGRLVIDLPAVLSGEGLNVTVEDGDFLHIPAHNGTVTVVGEVQYPSSHLYEEGLSYKDFLARAGGARKRADRKRIYIIRANGQVVLPKNSWFGAHVREGDTVVVPIDAEYTDRLSVFSAVTQILYQLGIAYDAIND